MEYVEKIVENWFLPSWCSDNLVRYLHPCCLPEQDHSYLLYSSQTNTSLRGATRDGTTRKTRSQPLIINDTTWKIHSRPNLNLKSVFFNLGIETYLFLYKTYRTWTSLLSSDELQREEIVLWLTTRGLHSSSGCQRDQPTFAQDDRPSPCRYA